MELTDKDYGTILEIIRDLDGINPNAGVQIKFTDGGFTLYYIAAENIDYKDSPLYRECMEIGNKRLNDVEKELKSQFKEETGKALAFDKVDEREDLEIMSPALQRYYLRIFRTFELK
jgi:hypothetical protein